MYATTVKPGQFHCHIRQCVIDGCEVWFVGTPASRFCDDHKRDRQKHMKLGWQRKYRDTGVSPGAASRFSEDEIKEMRDMFHKHTVAEIAAHFNCNKSLIYKWQHRDPLRFREA